MSYRFSTDIIYFNLYTECWTTSVGVCTVEDIRGLIENLNISTHPFTRPGPEDRERGFVRL
jgi:hypothetical protein